MRPIDPSKFAKLARPDDFGPATQLQWLPISSLVVDEHYQRPIAAQGEKTVTQIVGKFDWRMFAPVIVSPIAGGLYAIVDGQHRTTAAAACGCESVPCAIIMADRQTQAKAFDAINGVVTRVSRHQQFKAALAGGDPLAVRIKSVADAAGIRIMYFNTAACNLKPRETVALEAIKRAIVRHGDRVTITALRAVSASAGEMEGYFKAAIVQAAVEVLADHPEWVDHDALLIAFEEIDLEDARVAAYAEAAARRGVAGQDLLQAAIVTHLDRLLKRAAA